MIKILWVDDEIELLKPHILFLQNKGYTMLTANNGHDAIEIAQEENLALVILDEMMPGLTGLETLPLIKEVAPTVPIIMVTKSEEENIMNRAVGSRIADYLIKPVNPMQVLLSIKKNVHREELVTQQSTEDYRSQFGVISGAINSAVTFDDWIAIYKKLVSWDMELAHSTDRSVVEILQYQKNEADNEYAKFIKRNYVQWFDDNDNRNEKPLFSHNLMRQKVFKELDKGDKTLFLLIDNFRYDQWLMVRDMIASHCNIEEEDFYCAILPTATQYARNALFAGLTPLSISKLYPQQWLNDNQDGGKNLHEEEFLSKLLAKSGYKQKLIFEKLVRPEAGKRLLDNLDKIYNADFAVIVYNFLDILSHARTETDIIREIANDEAAFRSLTRSWFEHSELLEIIRIVSQKGMRLVITSDHGTRKVQNGLKVVGDRETSTNLRYKTGRNLAYDSRSVFSVKNPATIGLPSSNITSEFIFAYGDDFLAYPNNYNHYVRYYRDTFQHGGISMEEMIVPYMVLTPKQL
ncbi:MAG: PglZ domain-containing protein [Rikenellaceae bacterium]